MSLRNNIQNYTEKKPMVLIMQLNVTKAVTHEKWKRSHLTKYISFNNILHKN